MNNNSHNGDHRQPPSASPGHPSLPPHYQHHLQQLHSQHPSATQDPQLAFLLANATAAAAARGQPTPGAVPGHLGVGNNNIGAGIVHPGRFGGNNEHHGNPGAMPNAQSAAAQLFEEQILQRASALRAEALMQQRQQSQQAAHSQQHQMNPQNFQIQAALQAFQQQQQLSSLNGAAPTPASNGNTSPTITTDLIQQQQEKVLMARAQALRDLGLGGSAFEKLDMNRLIQHRQHTQQQQQRAQFGLEHEIERVRQAQRLAAMGSPKPSVPSGPPVPPDGANAVRSSVSAAAAASEAVQKALPSSNEGSERGIPSASKPVIPTPPKPPAEVVKTETGAASGAASKPSPELSSSSPASGKSTPQPKATAGGMAGSPEPTKATKETAGAGAAAAAAVRCKTKEELRKNPGTVIVPCRARGMPMDHNFISAYFVISEDAKHGENLVCSYYACRNGGIKFRYCAYCMAPVAKRNFSRRHDHGMSKNKGAAKIKDEEEEEEDDDTLGGSENTGSDKGSTSIVAMPSQLTLKRPKEVASSDDGSKRQRLEPAPTISTEAQVKDIAEDVSSKRRSMWNDLLAKRPRAKDPNTLSSWLNEVLAVSDLEFPLEQVGTNMDHPFGKLLVNELPKLAKPAATPTEDEAGHSSGAVDTMDTSNDSQDNSNSGSNNTAINTSTADTVVGNEKTPTASSKDEKDTASAGETAKDETTETKKPTEEDSSSKEQETKDPDTPVRDNTKTESTSDNNNSSSSKGVKLLGKKSKLSPKKIIIAGVQEESRKEKKKEDEGFAGSFADWRDRKKGKSLKKGSGSLRK